MADNTPPRKKSITEIILDRTEIDAALDRAFYRAVLLHREANVPMSFWEDSKVVKVDPHTIPIPEKYANLKPFRY